MSGKGHLRRMSVSAVNTDFHVHPELKFPMSISLTPNQERFI
ncbi:hypothetical protein [Dendronalium sp. ChiSLP03b]|nr:hypothetical protein [Dendronalium sp. ChiSLP03b]